MLEYYQCPPGYCQCSRVDDDSSRCNSIYYYDDDDSLCVCNREGVCEFGFTLCMFCHMHINVHMCVYMYVGYLCGQCHNGKGVSVLLNKCVSCGKASLLLIIGLGR